MPTSVPNFNFLAPLVTEIWSGSQKKLEAADLFIRPLTDRLLQVAMLPATLPAKAYQYTKIELSSLISFGDVGGVPK